MEIMSPFQSPQATDERGGVTYHHNEVHIKAARQPVTGKDGDGVFHQRRAMAHSIDRKIIPVLSHSSYMSGRADGFDFGTGIVLESEGTFEWLVKWPFVFICHIFEPLGELRVTDAGTM